MPGIHPVFSIHHLHQAAPDNEFDQAPIAQPPVIAGNREEEWEIAEIVGKALRGQGLAQRIHYFVRWKGFNRTIDSWEPIENFRNAKHLVCAFENQQLLQPGSAKFRKQLAALKKDRPDVIKSINKLDSSNKEDNNNAAGSPEDVA